MSVVVGIDVGGTTCTIAIGEAGRKVLCISDQFPTRSAEGPDAAIDDIVAQIVAELDLLGKSPADVSAISLATPGPATMDGVLLKTPNLNPLLWDQCPIRLKLEQAFAKIAQPTPVVYIGDGQAAAVGEYAIRTGHLNWADSPVADKTEQFDTLFMIAVGTGLGGGEVRKGHPVQGGKGRAGHAGHILLPVDAFRYSHDRELKVGNTFCAAESAISLTALTHQLSYRLTLDQWKDHSLNAIEGTAKDKAKQLRELAGAGDDLALELMDDQAKALGIVLLNVQYIGDHDRLVIGGGVTEMATQVRDRYLANVKESYHAHALDGFRDFDAISFSVCRDDASVLGSLAYAYGGTL
ncbi:Glucokinase [Rubripirellula obstinata]|uniref:Glucokinase n=1 Tax=Rubripirellula obstinata TaxID=406547 RepID=A0A5B1CME3_9BACT|nr:ROK family protein [Rubripirellula obstinata]KAA1260523.1 Glucokinase [Rubripirellula obstinata]